MRISTGASETTGLLPSAAASASPSNNEARRRSRKQHERYWKVFGAILILATATVLLSFFSSSSSSSSDKTTVTHQKEPLLQSALIPVTHHSTHTLLSLDDATIERWDFWKGMSDWIGDDNLDAEGIKQNLDEFGTGVESFWKDTEASLAKDEKVGKQKFQQWWAHASEEEKRRWNNTHASLVNAEEEGKEKFRDFWNHASESEKAWWRKAVKQVKNDEAVGRNWWEARRFGERIKSFWNHTQASLPNGEKLEVLERNFQEWYKHANEEEKRLWNSTVKQLQHDKAVERKWWDASRKRLGHDEEVAERIERKFWDATKDEVGRDAKVTAEEERIFWNTTKQRIKHDKELWDEQERQWMNVAKKRVQHDEAVARNKSALFWNMTKKSIRQSWNTTNEKEKEWWNATQHWFRDYIQNQYSGLDPSRMALLYLNTSHAFSMLTNQYGWLDYSGDFFLLQSGFDVQINQAYCAVASSAALLNSLRSQISLPVDPMFGHYPYATQSNLLENDCVQKTVIRHNDTYDGLLHAPGGLSLSQTKGLLECNLANSSWEVKVVHVDPQNVTVDDVRRDLEDGLRHPSKRVIINYDRNELGQNGHGHFSPLGSYSKEEDAFLIMDVAKYKYPPAFVPTKRLYNALASIDHCGDWDYPASQARLKADSHRPKTKKEYRKAVTHLRCKSAFRGYIIVSDESVDDNSEKV